MADCKELAGCPSFNDQMKGMALRIGLIFVILGPLCLVHSETLAADWRFYAGSEFGSYHYNAENIGYFPNNIVRIWQKLVLTNKGRVSLKGEMGKEYENVTELAVLREMDCTSRRTRILEIAYCYEEGGVIKRESYQQIDWDSVIPDSVDDILHHAVCKQSKNGTSGDIENPYLPRFSLENLCQLKMR